MTPGQEKMMTIDWRQPSPPPEQIPSEAWEHESTSLPVLVYSDHPVGGPRWQVATYRVGKEDGGARWVSDCSEGWEIKPETILNWAALTQPENQA